MIHVQKIALSFFVVGSIVTEATKAQDFQSENSGRPVQEFPLDSEQEAWLKSLPPVYAGETRVAGDRAGNRAIQQADIIFIVDGSGSIASYDFDKQRQVIQNALTGSSSIIPADGTAAVAIVQFSSFARQEVSLTVIRSPADAADLAEALDDMVQMEGLTNLSTGLAEAQNIFSTSNSLAKRFVVITTDGGLSDPYPAIQRATQLRTMSNPAKLSTGQINYFCSDLSSYPIWRTIVDELKQIANAPGSSKFAPSQTVGAYRCFSEVPDYLAFFEEALCEFLSPADCLLDCNLNGTDDRQEPDCDGDWFPDTCELDCDGDGVPNDCDGYPGQSVVHVDIDVSGGAGDGSSWSNAYARLEDAILERRWDTTPCDQEYWVTAGAYQSLSSGGGEVYRYTAFPMPSQAYFYGGFHGMETARDQRNSNPATNGTVLSAVHPYEGEPNWNGIFGTDGLQFFGLDGFTLESADGPAIGIAAQFSRAVNQVVIRRCIIRDNNGPAIEMTGGRAIIQDVVAENNRTGYSDAGAIHLRGGGPHLLAYSTIRSNVGGFMGSVLMEPDLPVVVQNCLFRDNTQMEYGGALSIFSGIWADSELPSAYIYNAAFFDNQTQSDGGAIFDSAYGGIEASNLTLANNVANGRGGGWYKGWGQTSRVRNAVFWQNADSEGQLETSQIHQNGAEVDVNDTLIQACGAEFCSGGETNFSADPLFVNPNNNNFRLKKNSPAIDKGNNAEIAYDSFDLDGDRQVDEILPDLDRHLRIVDGDAVPGARVDLGAYEFSRALGVIEAEPRPLP